MTARAIWVFATLISHWRRRPGQLITTLVGLMIATALWSGVQALNAQARASYDRASALLGGAGTPYLVAPGGGRFEQSQYIALRRAGWDVSPVLEGRIEIAAGDEVVSVRIVGLDPVTAPSAGVVAFSAGGDDPAEGFDWTAFLTPPGIALAAPETLENLGLQAGDDNLVTAKGVPLPRIVSRSDIAPGVLAVDIGVAQTLLGADGALSRLLLDPDAPPVVHPINAVVGDALRLVEPTEDGELARLTDSFHLNLTAFGMLAFLVGLFIVHAAIGLTFEQRLPMLRTLRACGISARLLTIVLVFELFLLALVAGPLGVIVGYGIAGALLPGVAATLEGLYGASVGGSLRLEPSWWAAGIGASLLGALVAAGRSLARAYTMPLLASAQPTAWRDAQARQLRWQAFGAALPLTVAAIALILGEGLIAAFTVLTGVLLGVALLLPAILSVALTLAQRFAKTPIAMWFWADTRQQLSGLSLALMALLLALSANIGVGTMVESFRKTFTQWLDQRLASEIYISIDERTDVDALRDWLSARPEVSAILPTWRVQTQIAGWPTDILGFKDHATYRDTWPLIDAAPTLWEDVARGDAALISEQLTHRLNVAVGDAVMVATEAGDWALTVAAIYPDYGNPRGQLVVANDALRRNWPTARLTTLGVRAPPAQAPEIIEALVADLAFDEDRLIDQATLKRFSTRVFEQTFSVTAALNTLTLGVAGVALLTSLLTLSQMRLPQLAPLWATGVTRGRLAVLEFAKMLALALFTAIIAVPLGLALAWGLVAIVNVEAFGWRLPLHFFPWQWAGLIGLALLATAIAAAWPVLTLWRIPPATLLKVFADER